MTASCSFFQWIVLKLQGKLGTEQLIIRELNFPLLPPRHCAGCEGDLDPTRWRFMCHSSLHVPPGAQRDMAFQLDLLLGLCLPKPITKPCGRNWAYYTWATQRLTPGTFVSPLASRGKCLTQQQGVGACLENTMQNISKTLHWFWKLIPRGEKNASLKIKPGKSGFQPVRCLTFLHSWMLSLPHTFSDNNNRISNNHNRKARSETKVELNAKRLGGVKFHAENYAPKKYNLGNHT